MCSEKKMKIAIRLAGESSGIRFKHGCAIFKGKTLISFGCNNSDKTHPKAIMYKYQYLHAETAAMIGVSDDDLKGSTVYVARVNPSGQVRMSKPCPICEGLMRKHGIRKVVFTTSNGEFGRMIL